MIRRLLMRGGPRDHRVYRYSEPLPRIVCFQQFSIDSGWVVHEYVGNGAPRRRHDTRRDPVVYSFLRSRRPQNSASLHLR